MLPFEKKKSEVEECDQAHAHTHTQMRFFCFLELNTNHDPLLTTTMPHLAATPDRAHHAAHRQRAQPFPRRARI
jgi:hypothetical protein